MGKRLENFSSSLPDTSYFAMFRLSFFAEVVELVDTLL